MKALEMSNWNLIWKYYAEQVLLMSGKQSKQYIKQ